MQHSEVIVVGAGPVGALAALGLAQRGIEVTLLDAEEDIVASPRAMVYYWHVLDGLDRLGILDDMNTIGLQNRAFLQRVPATGRQAVVPLDPVREISPFDYNLHLGQHEVVRIALRHLTAFEHATVVRGARVTGLAQTGSRVDVRAEHSGESVVYSAARVVGADGARSAVRSALGMGFQGTTWPDRFVATNLWYPFDEQGGLGYANMLFDPANGCVIARIDNTGLYRWTWSEPAFLPEESVLERIPARLAALGFGEGDYEVQAATPYRMHQRSADAMKDGRVVLVGDAAHVTNPTGGFGLTSGLYDVFALVDVLAHVVRGLRDERELDRWADERLGKFRESASPMASYIKHMVYDEADLPLLDRFVADAAAPVDAGEALRRLTEMTVLRSQVPTHHLELESA